MLGSYGKVSQSRCLNCREICRHLGVKRVFKPDEIPLLEGIYAGPKYGVPSPGGRTHPPGWHAPEGIFSDPLYRQSLRRDVGFDREGEVRLNEPIIFLHTGGLPAAVRFLKLITTRMQRSTFLRAKASLRNDCFLGYRDCFVREGKNGDAFAEYTGKVARLLKQMLAEMKQALFWPMMEGVAPSLVNDVTVLFGRDFTLQKELLETIMMPVLALSRDVDMLLGVDTSFFAPAAKAIGDMVQYGTFTLLSGQNHDIKPEVIAPILSEVYSGA